MSLLPDDPWNTPGTYMWDVTHAPLMPPPDAPFSYVQSRAYQMDMQRQQLNAMREMARNNIRPIPYDAPRYYAPDSGRPGAASWKPFAQIALGVIFLLYVLPFLISLL